MGQSPWATPTVFDGVFNGLQVPVLILGYSTSLGRIIYQFFGGPHIWISLVALITGFPRWLSYLDFFGGPHFWIYGQF